jgi:hypothetical protein
MEIVMKKSNGGYSSPEVDVHELLCEGVICYYSSNNEGYELDDEALELF